MQEILLAKELNGFLGLRPAGVITAAASVGIITEVFSVDNPRISAQQRNHPASSAMSILAHGNSFGTFDSTTIFRIKETATEATS